MNEQRTPEHEQEYALCREAAQIMASDAPYSKQERALRELTRNLRLNSKHWVEVGTALHQCIDKLQTAQFPFAYLRKCAVRQIRSDELPKLHQVPSPDNEHEYTESECIDYAWFAADVASGDDRFDPSETVLPRDLTGPDDSVNWDEIARRAGLTAEQTQFLKARAAGVSETRMIEQLGWDAQTVERVSKSIERKKRLIGTAALRVGRALKIPK